MRRLSIPAIIYVAVLLAATGCGGVRHTPVSGSVTMEGQPYGNVVINFVPVEGGGGDLLPTGKADDKGEFRMGTETPTNGVKPGKYKVTVIPGPDPNAERVMHPSYAFRDKAKAEGPKKDATKEYTKFERASAKAKKTLPSIYADPRRTPLDIVEITNEPKEVKLDLKSGAK
jgi:hypothetical protein